MAIKVEVYKNLHKDCFSIRHKGLVIQYSNDCIIYNPKFVVQPAGRQKVLEQKRKNVHAFVRGFLDDEKLPIISNILLQSGTKVSYNPYKFDYFLHFEQQYAYLQCRSCLFIKQWGFCMDGNKLQVIIDYKLSEDEAKAYKLALIWEVLTRKMFPREKGIACLPKNGDPRRSSLFKFCWKLLRETKGLLPFEDYRLYMRANLTIIKANNLHLSPNVLCGDSAWIRWRIWKRLYDQKMLEKSGEHSGCMNVKVTPTIIRKLESTKRFLFEKCDGEPTLEKLREFYDNKSLNLWVGSKIDHLYLLLSPWVKEIAPIQLLEKEMFFDSKVHEKYIDDNVKIYFRQEFSHEFDD